MHDLYDIDITDPAEAFHRLEPLGPRFLIERATADRRYALLGLGDAVEVLLDDAGLHIDDRTLPVPSRSALLDGLRLAMAQAPRLSPDVDTPFPGGLVGYGGYDMVRRFEDLAPRGRGPQGAWLAPRTVLLIDRALDRAVLLHAGDDEERRALTARVRDLLAQPLPRRPFAIGAVQPSLGDAEFLAAVDRAKQHITAGDVFQLVLSIRYAARCSADPLEVYRALRRLNPSPYMFYLRFGDTTVVGSSPEALLRLEGRDAFLQPIAGTRPLGATPEDDAALELDLVHDPKEAAEHVMLVDLARNDLGRVATPGSVHVRPFRVVRRFSHVMHLVSGVRGTLEPEADAFDLYAAAFPAGTVTGAPKVRALQLIDELEPVARGVYAGTVGTFGVDGSADQGLTIRTLIFDADEVSWQAGAGIVSRSVPAAELAEIRAKSAAMEAALTAAGGSR